MWSDLVALRRVTADDDGGFARAPLGEARKIQAAMRRPWICCGMVPTQLGHAACMVPAPSCACCCPGVYDLQNVLYFPPLRLGPPSHGCRYCGAFFWYEEPVRRQRRTSSPEYNNVDKSLSSHFFENIIYYNSMFALSPYIYGCQGVIDSINDDHAPYRPADMSSHQVIVAKGGNNHNMHNYIFFTLNEIKNRLFRSARDRMAGGTDDKYIIRMFGESDKHGDSYSAPVASEIVGLVV
ncbi:hypothetical protein EJB05_43526 [Eragrostis curvula]|uniref:Uncharacterized protein n=1 Tax=Eragrostis curvula TaxID=38414 RepID=A0A5J9TFG4_9POAL|nr:hypothetical protein EJB05_43526 [Eragrostis curvula]